MIIQVFKDTALIQRQGQSDKEKAIVENLSPLWENIIYKLLEINKKASVLTSSVLLCKHEDKYYVMIYTVLANGIKMDKCYLFDAKGNYLTTLRPELFQGPRDENESYSYDKQKLNFIRALIFHAPIE